MGCRGGLLGGALTAIAEKLRARFGRVVIGLVATVPFSHAMPRAPF